MTTIFGIKNCDTIKKARRWLEQNNIPYQFHDYRADGVDAALLAPAIAQLSWQPLLNTRGTTWRGLPEEAKQVTTEEQAIALMVAHPALIKRPLLAHNGQYWLGFKEADYQQVFYPAN